MKTRYLILSILSCLWLVPGSAATLDPAKLIADYENLGIGSEAKVVEDVRLSIGGMKMTLVSGRVVPVLAGSDQVGFFFSGKGSIEYHTSYSTEFPVVQFNLKNATSLNAEKSGSSLVIRDTFDSVMVSAAAVPLPNFPGTAASVPAEEFKKHRQLFSRTQITPTSHLYVQQKIDAPSQRAFMAQMSGGKETLLYAFDDVDDHSESLLAFYKPETTDSEFRKQLWPTLISEQPIGRDGREPPLAPFLLTEIDYTLIASEGKDVTLSITETLTPQQRPQRIFRMDLYNKMYAERGFREVRLKSVTDQNGASIPFNHQNDTLVIALPSPVAANTSVKVKFEIEGDFLIRPSGDSFWQLGVAPWFPQPDLGGQYYTVHSVVKVKKPFVPFAPGETIRRTTEGDYNVTENKIDKPVQFAVVLAGRYDFQETERKGVKVRIASYAGKNPRAWKQLTDLTFGIIDYYENFLGPFPFSEFNILEKNEYGYGQAPPGFMFITKEAFNPLMGEASQFFSQGINERFAHEIAHQYWGHVVKMPSGEEQWITESFSEYSAALFLKALKGKGQNSYDQLVTHWKRNARIAADASPIPLANRLASPNDWSNARRKRTYLVYDKGAYLLAQIHKEVGDQMFLSFLKSYQKSFRWKFGSTNHVIGLLKFITKKDYSAFFDSYFWGTGMPGS